jgi:hypothetical protein
VKVADPEGEVTQVPFWMNRVVSNKLIGSKYFTPSWIVAYSIVDPA